MGAWIIEGAKEVEDGGDKNADPRDPTDNFL